MSFAALAVFDPGGKDNNSSASDDTIGAAFGGDRIPIFCTLFFGLDLVRLPPTPSDGLTGEAVLFPSVLP